MSPWHSLTYLAWLIAEVVRGSLRVARSSLSRRIGSEPAIIEMPLRCSTDFQITALTSSITITPGTLVVGVASSTAEHPPTIFVHVLFRADRETMLAELTDMETRLLRALRGGKERQ